jgi:amidase/aspartyl-tRNA(Asn)/glutamyl-tRNA(Gln) amidotransferase subunit A
VTLSTDLSSLSAAELAARIKRRELSPVEVVDGSIERIEVRNPSLNAFVHLGFDDARRRAEAAERAVMAGEELGPLHGVPSAIKDLFDFKPGWPSTFGGVRALQGLQLNLSCIYAERMERAGAILVGKTNSPVMGFRGTCDNYLFGPSRNPFNVAKNTGGSSGGSAAAVADGLVPIAEGTDGGGSIRIPAAWCGVYGYKASFGRVPYVARPNAFAGDSPFLFEGTLSRTVEDAALGMTALTGYHPGDPFSLDETVDYIGALGRSIKGMRIGYSPALDVFPVEPEVARLVAGAVRLFEQAGAHVEEVQLGITRPQHELSDLWCRQIIASSITTFDNFKRNGLDLLGDHRDDFPPEFLRWMDVGYRMSLADFVRDQEIRTEIYDAVQGVFGTYDLLVTPTLACTAVDNTSDGNTKGPTLVNGEEVDPLIGWCLTYPFNFTGHPAASIPAGLSSAGLPVGMQIVGRRYADVDVLAASAAFEQIKPWRETYIIPSTRPLT